MEISENLIRNEGTVLEQSLGWARMKALQEAAGLARKNGGDRKSEGQNDHLIDQPSFVAQTQEAWRQDFSK